MKRFIALILVLSFFVGLYAKGETVQKQECTCKEGEENCPCLAQSQEVDTKEEARPHPFSVVVPQKVPMKFIPKAVIGKWAVQKRAARMEEKRLRRAMANLKMQMKKLKARSKGVPLPKRKMLLAKRVAIKRSCLEMKMRIKAAVLKVKQMRKTYKEVCKKRVKQILQRTVQSIRTLKIQVVRLKSKVKTIKAAMRLAAKEDKKALVFKLKKAVAKVVILNEKIKAKTLKVIQIRKTVKRQIIIKKQKKVKVFKMKVVKLNQRKAVLVRKRTIIVTALKAVNTRASRIKQVLRRSSSADPTAMRLIRKLKVVMTKAQDLKSSLKKNTRKIMRINLFKRALFERINVVHQSIVRIHEDDRCLKLQKKLEMELKLANKLKTRYEKACQVAAMNQHQKSIQKAKAIKNKINRIKLTIQAIKASMGKGPKRMLRPMIIKQQILKAHIRKQQVKMIKVQQMIDKTQILCKKAKEEEKAKLLNDKQLLMQRFEKIKAKLLAQKKDYLMLKVRLRQKCNLQLNKQKALTKGLLLEIHNKLALSKKISADLHRALLLAKSEAALRKKAEKLKMAQLSAENKDLQDKIMAERKAIRLQIRQTKQMQVTARKEAKKLQVELEQKAQATLKKQRKIAKKKVGTLKLKLTSLAQKHVALKKALMEEKDAKVKAALLRQYKLQKVKIAFYKKQLRLKTGKILTLNLELKLRRSAVTAQQKEMAMKRVLAVKKAKVQEAKLVTAWNMEESKELELAMKKLHAEYDLKIGKLRTKLGQLRASMKQYKLTMTVRYKKETASKLDSQREAYEARIKKLRGRILKARKTLSLYKISAAKAHGKKERALRLRLSNEAAFEVNRMTMKLNLEIQKQKAALKALRSGLKADLTKEQAILNDRIMKIKAELASLKSEALRKEAVLRATLEKAMLARRELRSQLTYTKGETRSKRRNIAMKKREVERKNKHAIVEQGETDKERIAASQRHLAKIKMDALTMEAKLTARLKAAVDESKQFKHALEVQKQKYSSLNDRFSAWRSQQEKKHSQMLEKEKKKYESLHEELQAQARSCSTLLESTRTEIVQLEAKFKEAMTLLAQISDTKAKRSKARELISAAESKLHSQKIKISMATAKRAQLCDVGTPGPLLRKICEKLAQEISELQKTATHWQSDISSYEVTFSSH